MVIDKNEGTEEGSFEEPQNPTGDVKYFPKQFQKLVIQTLLQKGKSEDSSESEEEFEWPQFIGTNLDLTKKHLKEFPVEVLRRAEYVQYLYLDRNKLSELPELFFQCLRHLKWLDLRNNLLVELPKAELENHAHLEFLLLQGNRIKNLPTELGSVPNLKGLQITGNPITNVPYEVIIEGFHSIIKHLRKANAQEKILLPNSEAIVVRSSTLKGEDKSVENNALAPNAEWVLRETAQAEGQSGIKAKPMKAEECDNNLWKEVGEEMQGPLNLWNETKKLFLKSKICTRSKQKIVTADRHYVTKRRSRLGYKRKMITPEVVLEKAKKDLQIAKKKETLEKQARKIQRMKDKEVLKSWRRQTISNSEQIRLLDNYQEYPSKNFASDTPFDVDPEFLNMLNRADLYRSLKELEETQKRKKKRSPRLQISVSELEKQMKDIMKKLESIHVSSSESISPRTKQSHLCNKIAQMKEIQKSLQNLKSKNRSICGVRADVAN